MALESRYSRAVLLSRATLLFIPPLSVIIKFMKECVIEVDFEQNPEGNIRLW